MEHYLSWPISSRFTINCLKMYAVYVIYLVFYNYLIFFIKGSFATASCTRCKYQVKADDVREDIFTQRIPTCPKCRVNALPSLSEINCSENYRGK